MNEVVTPDPGSVHNLAIVSVDFAIAAIVLALVSALLLYGLLEIGLRGLVQRGFIAGLTRGIARPGLFGAAQSMPYRQFCGHLSARINQGARSAYEEEILRCLAEIDRRAMARALRRAGIDPATDAPGGSEAELYVRAERGIDRLQDYLGNCWSSWNYVLAFFATLIILVVLILTPNPFNPDTLFEIPPSQDDILLLSIAIVSSLIAPLWLKLLEKYFSLR